LNLLLEHLAKTWHIEVLYSLPETFIFFTFSFIFFGHSFHSFWKKLVILALIQGWVVDTLVIYVPGYIQGINSLLSYFILFSIIYRETSIIDKIRIPLFMFVILTISEISSSAIMLNYFTIDELRSPIHLITEGWPYFIAFGIMAYILNKRKISIGHRIYIFIVSNKAIFYLSIVLFLQLFSIAALSSSSTNNRSNITVLNFLSGFSIIISLIVIFLVINLISKLKSQVFRQTEEMYIEQINNLFTSIKSQRHDFLNNAQVMIAMLYKQDKEGLHRYLDQYIHDLQDLSDIININEPAISALIQTKKIFAEQQNIQFEYHFSGLENINLGIKVIDVVKILGNLIDNAFDEVLQISIDQRYVGIVSWLEPKTLCINVSNSLLESITAEQVEQMFEANYTSKQDGHSGLGLAIIKQKIAQLKGEILTQTEDDTITFTLRLPLKTNEFKNTAS
jgi:signal transduction histidine kinase